MYPNRAYYLSPMSAINQISQLTSAENMVCTHCESKVRHGDAWIWNDYGDRVIATCPYCKNQTQIILEVTLKITPMNVATPKKDEVVTLEQLVDWLKLPENARPDLSYPLRITDGNEFYMITRFWKSRDHVAMASRLGVELTNGHSCYFYCWK